MLLIDNEKDVITGKISY